MDITLIIYFIIVIALIVLAFKFIKKIIFAVLTSIMIVLISIAGVGVLVYLDYQSLSKMDNATINVAYLSEDEYVTGVSFPISADEELDPSQVQLLTFEEYEEEINSNSDNTFTLSVDESVFSIIQDEIVSLNDLMAEQGMNDLFEQDLEIEVSILMRILDSQTPREDLAGVVLESINLGPTLEDAAKPILLASIEELEESQNLDVKSIAFSLLLDELVQKESNIVAVVMEYQDGNIEVHPNKLSFRLLRYVPISIIRDMITNNISSNNLAEE